MGKLSRTKGAAWERECAHLVSGRRNLEQVRDGGCDLIDHGYPIEIECKVGTRINLWAATRQAIKAADGTGKYPVVFARLNRQAGHSRQDVAVLPLEDFIEIIESMRIGGMW